MTDGKTARILLCVIYLYMFHIFKTNISVGCSFRRSYTWAGVPAVLMMFHKIKTYRGRAFAFVCISVVEEKY